VIEDDEPGFSQEPEIITAFPDGTILYPPDEKFLVFEFPTHNDAILFYELILAVNSGKVNLELRQD
jgi:hypothetical protein